MEGELHKMKITGSMSLVVSPGVKVKLTIPVSSNLPVGSFRSTDAKKMWLGGEVDMLNGFIVENSDAGTISPLESSDTACNGVYYTQKTHASNKVIYFGSLMEEFTFNMVHIPVHDHSSLVQGGPAFGTYFSESDIQQTPPGDGGTT